MDFGGMEVKLYTWLSNGYTGFGVYSWFSNRIRALCFFGGMGDITYIYLVIWFFGGTEVIINTRVSNGYMGFGGSYHRYQVTYGLACTLEQVPCTLGSYPLSCGWSPKDTFRTSLNLRCPVAMGTKGMLFFSFFFLGGGGGLT